MRPVNRLRRTLLAALLIGPCARRRALAQRMHEHGHAVGRAGRDEVGRPAVPARRAPSSPCSRAAWARPAPFTARLRLPANYRIPAHWHPGVERITVVSGTFYMGAGEALDIAKGVAVPVGGFTAMPAKTPHYAYTLARAGRDPAAQHRAVGHHLPGAGRRSAAQTLSLDGSAGTTDVPRAVAAENRPWA